jgi:hypothetical protein
LTRNQTCGCILLYRARRRAWAPASGRRRCSPSRCKLRNTRIGSSNNGGAGGSAGGAELELPMEARGSGRRRSAMWVAAARLRLEWSGRRCGFAGAGGLSGFTCVGPLQLCGLACGFVGASGAGQPGVARAACIPTSRVCHTSGVAAANRGEDSTGGSAIFSEKLGLP